MKTQLDSGSSDLSPVSYGQMVKRIDLLMHTMDYSNALKKS